MKLINPPPIMLSASISRIVSILLLLVLLYCAPVSGRQSSTIRLSSVAVEHVSAQVLVEVGDSSLRSGRSL